MKPTWLTKNRRGRRAGPGLSLFPFLAVLICTMGALVLLLLAVTRQARVQAICSARANAVDETADLRREREAAQWRVEQLENSRRETESQLADARLVLGHIEDHAMRLRQQVGQLMASCKDLDCLDTEGARQRTVKQEEIQQVETQVAEARHRLGKAKEEVPKRPRSYAVIPYEGPNQTHRRPIYLECLAEGVVLRPENIAFVESDFDGPLGPGNPLAAALRAAREYLALQGATDPQRGGEPYPLLLVRPSGIPAYGTARAAMKSWGPDFGYELISEEWKLQFPPPDPGLAKTVERAVAVARVQQEQLIAAAPSRYGKRARSGNYRVSPGGGIAGDGGPAEGEGSGFYSTRPAARYGGPPIGDGSPGATGPYANVGGAAGGTPGGVPGGAGGIPGTAGGMSGTAGGIGNPGGVPGGAGGIPGTAGGMPGTAGGIGSPGGVPGGAGGTPANGNGWFTGAGGVPGNSGGVPGNGNGVPGSAGGVPGNGVSPGMAGGTPGTPAAPGNVGGSSGWPAAQAGQGGTLDASGTGRTAVARPDGYVTGRPLDGPPAPPAAARDPSVPLQPATPLRPGEWQPTETYVPPKRDDDSDDKKRRKDRKSLADKRGEDWGLRDAVGAAAITRPIRVDCYPDRFVVVAEPGGGGMKTIPLSGSTDRGIDKFVAAVWEHMDAWGIAGKNMYWRPILNVYVAPGAQQRFEELSDLLRGSGLTVQRKP